MVMQWTPVTEAPRAGEIGKYLAEKNTKRFDNYRISGAIITD